MSYKYKFMDEAMKTEMDELLQGDHGSTIAAFGLECANAAVSGYKHGCMERGLIAAGGGLLIFGAVSVGKKIVDKCKEKKLDESKNILK